MHAVHEVHVPEARWTEHRRVALCATPERMARRIIGRVGLDLGDARRHFTDDEQLVEQRGRDDGRVALSEGRR